MEQLPEITPTEVVKWAQKIREAVYKGERKTVDLAYATRFYLAALDAKDAGKAKDAGWIRLTTFFRWIVDKALDDDKLGDLCLSFLNRTGIY